MKKSKLIEMLNAIEGDPDIVLWSGMVGDWMDVGELVPSSLVKMTFQHYAEMVRLERCIDMCDWTIQLTDDEINELKEIHRTMHYEVNPYVTKEDVATKKYRAKRIVYISAKLRNIKGYDRIGDYSY